MGARRGCRECCQRDISSVFERIGNKRHRETADEPQNRYADRTFS